MSITNFLKKLDPTGVVGAGADLLGGTIGSLAQAHENTLNRKFQREMLQRQQDFADKTNQEQMDFQREVNQANFDWNDEGNRKQRLIDAGYNPFLYDNKTLGSASGTNLGTGSSSLPPNQISSGGPLSGSIGQAMSSYQGAMMADQQRKGQEIANKQAQVQLDALNYEIGGKTGLQWDTYNKSVESKRLLSEANIAAIDESFKQLEQKFALASAVDENGQPIVDENGDAVNNYDAKQQSIVKQALLQVSKGLKEMAVMDSEISLNAAHKLLAGSNIKLNSKQMEVFDATITELSSRTDSNRAQAGLYRAETSTENGLRPYRVSRESHEANKSKAGAALTWNQADAQEFENEFTRPMVDWVRTPQGYWQQREVGAAGRLVKHVSPVVK